MTIQRLALAAAASTAAIVGLLTFVSPAQANDSKPCGPEFQKTINGRWCFTHYCPHWAPNNRIPVHESPQKANPQVVGYIDAAGNDWYECQLQGKLMSLGSYTNKRWAYTIADNGRIGWVNEIYFQGGSNDEEDAGLYGCA